MKRRIGWQVGAVALLTVLAAVIGFAVLITTVRALEQATDAARRHERVASEAQRVRALVVDAETSVRGFAITDQGEFLEPLDAAKRELPGATSAMRADAGTREESRLAVRVSDLAETYLSEYADPLVAIARRDPAAARTQVATLVGKRRVDEIRAQVAALVEEAERAAIARQEDASRSARAAQWTAVVAGLVILTLLAVLLISTQRRVLGPVRRATEAARRVGAGDLSVRLGSGRVDEVGQLADALNRMAEQLQEGADEIDAQHTELESQNSELEAQSVELETQAVELEQRGDDLEQANAELRERSRELEEAGEQLRAASKRVRRYAEVAESLALVPDVERRAERLLEALGDAMSCPIGAVYARTAEHPEELRLVAHRGLASPPATAEVAGGLVGRAVAETRSVLASHPETGLQLDSLGGKVVARQEVHVPLLVGEDHEEVLGVVSLARTDPRPFDDDELEMLQHLVDSSAMAMYNALVSAQRQDAAVMISAVLDSVNEAILVLSPEGEVVVANPPMDALARRVCHLDAGEPWDLATLSVGFRAEVADPLAMDDRTARFAADPHIVDRQQIELPALGLWIERYAAPVLGAGGEVTGQIIVIRDVTEERQAERAKDDLMSTVSHELRTPLAAILGFTELLVAREYEAEERTEYLTTVNEQALRLSALVDDFLDLQRMERRGLDHHERFDLRPILLEEVALYSGQSQGHELDATIPDEPLPVDGDPGKLRRAVANLLSNAIKYSPDGGSVRLEARRENGHIAVGILDQGVGIPVADRDRVFDRFYRVDSSATARIGGTGLGLALVRDIVRAHGGEVGVESVEGQGSRFWVTLPAATPKSG